MTNRKFENPSNDFIDRIIQKSYGIVQKKPILWTLQNMFKELSLPSPQYALSLIFVAGIVLSIFMPDASASTELLEDFYMQGDF